MGFSSQDDLINEITNNGKTDTLTVMKTTIAAGTAGYWYDLSTSLGFPVANTFGGAEATFIPTDNTWSEGVLPNPDVSPDTRHVLNLGVGITAAAGAPWFVQLVDMVGYVKLTGTNVSTTGTKTVTMTPISNTGAKVDRYANGEGLRAFVAAISTMGANAPTMQITYTNTANTAGRVTTAGAVSLASAPNGTVLHSGNAANKYGPFLPLQGNDTGIKDIESLTWGGTAHASGSVIIGLVYPIGLAIPLPATGLYNIMDFLNTVPSLPRIKDGANLRLIIYSTGATTSGATVYSQISTAWG
jgi:hypothetical protein